MKNTTKIIEPVSKEVAEQLKQIVKDKFRICKQLAKNPEIEPSNLIKPIQVKQLDNCEDISFWL